MLLVLTGSYEQLFAYVVFSGIIFHVITGLALFELRRQRPDWPRPYRVTGYPWVPGVFVIAMTGILLNTVYERPIQSLSESGSSRLACRSFNGGARSQHPWHPCPFRLPVELLARTVGMIRVDLVMPRDAARCERDVAVRLVMGRLVTTTRGQPCRLNVNRDCGRTVIRQVQDLEEHRGLPTHTQ